MNVFSRLVNRISGPGLGAKLVRMASGSFVINVTGAGIAFALQLFLARILNASGYGAYMYVITWINFLTLVSVLGFDTASLRFVPQYIAKKEVKLALGFIVRSKQIVLFTSLCIIVAMSSYLLVDKQNLGIELYQVFIVGLALLPIHSLIRINGSVLQGLQCLLLSLTIQVIIRPILIATGVVTAFYYCNNKETLVEAAMISNVLSGLVVAICLSLYLKRRLVKIEVGQKAKFNTKNWIKTALPLLLNSGFHVVLAQGDILLIGYLLNAEQVGLYAAANKTASLVIFILTAVNSVAAPMISQLYGEGDMRKLQRVATISARVTFVVSLPICLTLMVFNEYIISMFGEEFIKGGVVLSILSGAQLITALTGSVGYILIMTGNQNRAIGILAGAAIINLSLNVLLIPEYGIVGAAIATVASTLIWNILMYISTYKLVGIDSTILDHNR